MGKKEKYILKHRKIYLKILITSYLVNAILSYLIGMSVKEILENTLEYGLGLTSTGVLLLFIGHIFHHDIKVVDDKREI